jgi:glycosyltransferase involved in cell wall biosynthesis
VREQPAAGAVVFGPGSEELGHLAREYRVADRVACLGELPRAQAQAVIGACDVFVRPTLADGDAVSVREALWLERPVAASAVGYRPGGVALFPAGDPEEVARAVLEALARGPSPAPMTDGVARVLELYAARVL